MLTYPLQHLKTHREKTIPCFGDYSGCGMLFECISTMMLHLEAGNCPCGMDRDRVDELAFECYQHRQYTNSWHEYFRYRCPDCDKDFSKFSGLLQHAESERCDADVGETPLCKALHYIDKRA